VAGPSALFAGYSNAAHGLATVPLNSDGSLGVPVDTTVPGASTANAAVSAVSVDANQTVFTADAGGFLDALLLPSTGLPTASTAISTGSSNPTSICNVVIFSN
jgi:hypothetical protein